MICSCGARYPDSDKACTYCGALNAQYKPPDTAEKNIVKDSQPVNPWDAFPGAKPRESQDSQRDSEQYPPWERDYLDKKYQQEVSRSAYFSAKISLICGILGNIIAGPIFGTIAIIQSRKAKRLGYPGGIAKAGFVLGIIAVAFWVVAMVVRWYIAPNFAPNLIQYFTWI